MLLPQVAPMTLPRMALRLAPQRPRGRRQQQVHKQQQEEARHQREAAVAQRAAAVTQTTLFRQFSVGASGSSCG